MGSLGVQFFWDSHFNLIASLQSLKSVLSIILFINLAKPSSLIDPVLLVPHAITAEILAQSRRESFTGWKVQEKWRTKRNRLPFLSVKLRMAVRILPSLPLAPLTPPLARSGFLSPSLFFTLHPPKYLFWLPTARIYWIPVLFGIYLPVFCNHFRTVNVRKYWMIVRDLALNLSQKEKGLRKLYVTWLQVRYLYFLMFKCVFCWLCLCVCKIHDIHGMIILDDRKNPYYIVIRFEMCFHLLFKHKLLGYWVVNDLL